MAPNTVPALITVLPASENRLSPMAYLNGGMSSDDSVTYLSKLF